MCLGGEFFPTTTIQPLFFGWFCKPPFCPRTDAPSAALARCRPVRRDDAVIKRRARAPRHSRAPRHAAGEAPVVSVGVGWMIDIVTVCSRGPAGEDIVGSVRGVGWLPGKYLGLSETARAYKSESCACAKQEGTCV